MAEANGLTLEKLKIDKRLNDVEKDVKVLTTSFTDFKDSHDKFADERQNTLLQRFDRMDNRIMWGGGILLGIIITISGACFTYTSLRADANKETIKENRVWIDRNTERITQLTSDVSESLKLTRTYIKKYQNAK